MRKALVLGDGIIGLTTALVAQEKGWDVCIYTDTIDDRMAKQAVSPTACALWYPALVGGCEKDLNRWCQYSFEVYKQQADLVGIKRVTNYEMIDMEEEWRHPPSSVSCLPNFNAYFHQNVPSGVHGVWSFDTYIISMDFYLPYLRELARDRGIQFLQGERILKLSDIQGHTLFDVIFNCAGLNGARLSEKSDEMQAVKGHLIFFPPIESSVSIGRKDFAIMPRNDYTVVGALFLHNFQDVRPTYKDRKTILTEINNWIDCKALDLEFQQEFSEKNILFERTGLRPYLQSGVCIHKWKLDSNVLVVDNFGHGGSGVTIAWGCAKDAIEMASEYFLS